MQEELNGSHKNETKDAKGPRQDDGVWAYARWERDSGDVEPEACNRNDRDNIDQDNPCGKPSRFDRTAPAELDQHDEGKDCTRCCAGQRPDDRVGNMKEVEKCGKQGKSSDQEAAFNVEAHETEMPVGEFAPQCTSEGDNHCRKTDK